MREKLEQAVKAAIESIGISNCKVLVEHLTDPEKGDYATAVALQNAKSLNIAPRALAGKIIAALGDIDGVQRAEIGGAGFINFFLAPRVVAESIERARKESSWGSNETLKGRRIMVEYTDPNPFKEFHIGHLMSNAIGEAISRLIQFSGAEVKRANYQGDVGPHVAKAVWGKMCHPELSWGKAYAAGATYYESYREEIDAINQKIYDRSDPKINELYDAGRRESLEHFEEIYKILGTKFDFYFFESETGPKGAAIVRAHPGVFEQSDGAIVFRGEKVGLHTRVFITSRGLPTYETKDLGLAVLKMRVWPCDISITVTAHEQNDYFKVVLAAMEKVVPDIASKILHISHGVMRLPGGKMSSRTGEVVTGESLLHDLTKAASARASESRAKDPRALARDVAVAAIKYQILKQAPGRDIIFERERALSLEGDSGPYLQYTHARAWAVVEKAREQNISATEYRGKEPDILTRFLYRFPEIVEHAAARYEPHHVTNYLLELASVFNNWYATEQILDGTVEASQKVAVTEAVARTLKNGLWILGIPAPEKM